MRSAFLILSGFLSISSFAAPIEVQVDQSVPQDHYSLGVGSALTLKVPGQTGAQAGMFLGKLIQPDGTFSKYMILDQKNSKAYLADSGDAIFPKMSIQPILRQYDQVDGNCTGYAMDHFIQQMHWSGFAGNGTLATALSTEKGRTQLLVTAIDSYYEVTQHKFSIEGIMNQFGKGYDFKCKKNVFTDTTTAISFVDQQMKKGSPVLISFYIGPNMATSDIKIVDYETNKAVDPRLWIPRKIGERQSGGHSVVAAAGFEFKGKSKLLMLDSDWSEPRVWDVQSYLGDKKTDIQTMEFYTCE